MTDKHLTPTEWKRASKGSDVKDAAFTRALSTFDSSKTPESKLAALDDLEKQTDLIRKASKADKDITSYLDEVEKASSNLIRHQAQPAHAMSQ